MISDWFKLCTVVKILAFLVNHFGTTLDSFLFIDLLQSIGAPPSLYLLTIIKINFLCLMNGLPGQEPSHYRSPSRHLNEIGGRTTEHPRVVVHSVADPTEEHLPL